MTGHRGRPKEYDAETALRAASGVFWAHGYDGTSLDDLSAAMEMKRPSIYRAFGGKQSLYREALAAFGEQMNQSFDHTVLPEPEIRNGLRQFYRDAVDVYTAGGTPMGCMIMCTAPSVTIDHPDVQFDMAQVIEQFDARMRRRIDKAIAESQLPGEADSKLLSKLLQAVLHSLAIRARAGESKASLRRFSDGAIGTLLARPAARAIAPPG